MVISEKIWQLKQKNWGAGDLTEDRDLKILRFVFQIEMRSRTHLSRLIAHLVPMSTVPSGLDKYPTSISVILYFRYLVFPLFRIYGIPTFHTFHFEVPWLGGDNTAADWDL